MRTIRSVGFLLAAAVFLISVGGAGTVFGQTNTAAGAAESAGPQAGQKVAFLGDSITFGGMAPGGYVTLVAEALKQQGREIVVIPAGVGGNTSKDMLARLDKDVLSKKPDWMTLSCGVNDVWHDANGVPLDQYQQNITSIVDQATAAGIKVVLLTSTMIDEDQSNAHNQKLVAYNDFLHQLAAGRHLPVAELNADMQAELAKQKAALPNLKGKVLTVDGVHMNALGNQMMAAGVLKAFGFTDEQIAQAKTGWQMLPHAAAYTVRADSTAAEYAKLREEATAQNQTVEEMLSADLSRDVQNRISSGGNSPKP